MTNPLYTIETLPTTSQAAIREFSDRYIASLGVAPANVLTQWCMDLCVHESVTSPMVTYPISALRTKYQKTEGGSRFRGRPAEKSFDLKVEEYDDGYEANLIDLFTKIFAWRKWQQIPARFVQAEQVHQARLCAALLEANPTIWDGKAFFADDHPANFSDSAAGTFDNLQATPKDVVSVPNIEAEVALMQAGVLDENGDEFGANPDTILVPTAKFEALKNKLAANFILDSTGAASVTNVYSGGRFRVYRVPQLTDPNDWYLVDSQMLSMGMSMCTVLRWTPPGSLGLRSWDESSDFFKDTGNIKVSSHIWYAAGLVYPHAIRKVVGA